VPNSVFLGQEKTR